jgi:Aspartyl protease/PDZ domain
MRRRELSALAGVVVGIGSPGVGSWAQAVPSGIVPLQLLRTGDVGGLPLIDVEFQGKPTRWLLDSGSSAALVTPALAQRMKLRELSSLRVAMAGGVQTLQRYRLPPLPGLGMTDAVDAIALDLQSLLGPAGAIVDGALGAPWLRQRSCRFDLARRQVQWRNAPGAAPTAAAVLPVRWDDGLPVVELSIGARSPDAFVFDTGNAGALVLFARRAGELLAGRGNWPSTTVRELGGSVSARHALIERLAAPGWVARQVPAALESGDAARRGRHFERLAGSLGIALFESGAVTLDGPGGQLIVELPGLPEPPPLPGGFGLRFERGTSLVVGSVVEGGPAAQSGVTVGDQVQAIDGADARQWSAVQAWEALAGRESMVMQLYRDGVSRRVELHRARFFPPLS